MNLLSIGKVIHCIFIRIKTGKVKEGKILNLHAGNQRNIFEIPYPMHIFSNLPTLVLLIPNILQYTRNLYSV